MAEPMTPEALGAIRARRDGAVRLAMRERLAERAQRGSWSATAAVALGIMDEDAANIAALLAEVERLRAIVCELAERRERVAMLVPVGESVGDVEQNIEEYVRRLARGVAEERARVVAWLRDEADAADPESSVWRPNRAADALERGEHEVTRG